MSRAIGQAQQIRMSLLRASARVVEEVILRLNGKLPSEVTHDSQ